MRFETTSLKSFQSIVQEARLSSRAYRVLVRIGKSGGELELAKLYRFGVQSDSVSFLLTQFVGICARERKAEKGLFVRFCIHWAQLSYAP